MSRNLCSGGFGYIRPEIVHSLSNGRYVRLCLSGGAEIDIRPQDALFLIRSLADVLGKLDEFECIDHSTLYEDEQGVRYEQETPDMRPCPLRVRYDVELKRRCFYDAPDVA